MTTIKAIAVLFALAAAAVGRRRRLRRRRRLSKVPGWHRMWLCDLQSGLRHRSLDVQPGRAVRGPALPHLQSLRLQRKRVLCRLHQGRGLRCGQLLCERFLREEAQRGRVQRRWRMRVRRLRAGCMLQFGLHRCLQVLCTSLLARALHAGSGSFARPARAMPGHRAAQLRNHRRLSWGILRCVRQRACLQGCGVRQHVVGDADVCLRWPGQLCRTGRPVVRDLRLYLWRVHVQLRAGQRLRRPQHLRKQLLRSQVEWLALHAG